MKINEILQALHRMQKDTSRLLFEASVSESETIRKAVAKADLALGNAASLVRQELSGTHRPNGNAAGVAHNGSFAKASSQRSVPVAGKQAPAPRLVLASQENESAVLVAAGVPEDPLPDDEYAIHLPPRNWESSETFPNPDDRVHH
ncbi:MAG TPA: hypothetical protein VMT20_21825 [Terriglobia bacterium]|nr:hypothetical protein [Terriglobia bacterium]